MSLLVSSHSCTRRLSPQRSDPQLLAQFYYADEELNQVAAELDSLDGRKDPQRCTLLVSQFRSCQVSCECGGSSTALVTPDCAPSLQDSSQGWPWLFWGIRPRRWVAWGQHWVGSWGAGSRQHGSSWGPRAGRQWGGTGPGGVCSTGEVM